MSAKHHLKVFDVLQAMRPKTRGDCAEGERPCPWWSCQYHIGAERLRVALKARGARESDRDVTDEELLDIIYTLPYSCLLDVADDGGTTLAEIGEMLDLTRERVRQIEEQALDELRFGEDFAGWTRDDVTPGGPALPLDPSDERCAGEA